MFIVTAVRDDDGKGRRAFNLQSDLEHLEAKIKRSADVRLVIIDPISSYLGPKLIPMSMRLFVAYLSL